MEKNKTGKYFKYAIGEIILVVIGILIALQINNWNENRKAQLEERNLYNRILTDLHVDESRIKDHIIYYKNDQAVLNQIHQETQNLSDGDSTNQFSIIRSARIFDLIITANYSKLTNEIKNPEVLKNIDKYFRLERHVNDALKMLSEFKENQVKPFLAKNGINDSKVLFENFDLNYRDLKEENIFSYLKLKEQYGTVELDQMLFDIGIRTSWAIAALEDLLNANEKIQLNLKNQLKKERL